MRSLGLAVLMASWIVWSRIGMFVGVAGPINLAVDPWRRPNWTVTPLTEDRPLSPRVTVSWRPPTAPMAAASATVAVIWVSLHVAIGRLRVPSVTVPVTPPKPWSRKICGLVKSEPAGHMPAAGSQ